MRRSWRRGGLTIIELLVCLSIVVVLIGLATPAVLSSRAAARQLSCRNHLHQLGIALHRRDAATTFFDLRHEIEAGNATADSVVGVLQCPADSANRTFQLDGNPHTWGRSSYVGVTGDGDRGGFYIPRYIRVAPAFPGPALAGVPYRDCTDGLSNTFLLGEQGSTPDPLVCWRYMGGASGQEPPNSGRHSESSRGAFRSQHSGGVNFLLGDGAVRFVDNGIALRVYRGMMTISGGEPAQ